MILLLVLALVAMMAFGLAFPLDWLFVVGVVFALVWAISFFSRGIGSRGIGGRTRVWR
jgi:hypothetical protein